MRASQRMVRGAGLILFLSLGLEACGGSATSSSDFFIRVQNIDGPPVIVRINGQDQFTMNCQNGKILHPAQNSVPDLPWTVSIVATDGADLFTTTLDGSLSHVISITRNGVVVDGPTPNPGMVPRFPCPSPHFNAPSGQAYPRRL
ncbi:MAG TPA: hypothetical protein VH371_09385 [Candidatus Limnocylindrales bacterium]